MKLLNIHTILFLLIFVISHPAIVSKGEQCSASLPTVRVVQTCPQNEAELSRAQQQKKCEHLAKYQKCTKPATFKYHCVLNAFSNETIEVCAQEIISNGYCVKFDEGSLLQMFGEDCTTYSNPCSTRFLSSELLQYLKCNDLIQKRMDSIKTTATPNHHNDPTRITTTPNPQNETNIGEILGLIYGFSGALLAMVLVCVVFFVVKRCRFCKSTEEIKSKSQEAMTVRMMDPPMMNPMTTTASFNESFESYNDDEVMWAHVDDYLKINPKTKTPSFDGIFESDGEEMVLPKEKIMTETATFKGSDDDVMWAHTIDFPMINPRTKTPSFDGIFESDDEEMVLPKEKIMTETATFKGSDDEMMTVGPVYLQTDRKLMETEISTDDDGRAGGSSNGS